MYGQSGSAAPLKPASPHGPCLFVLPTGVYAVLTVCPRPRLCAISCAKLYPPRAVSGENEATESFTMAVAEMLASPATTSVGEVYIPAQMRSHGSLQTPPL